MCKYYESDMWISLLTTQSYYYSACRHSVVTDYTVYQKTVFDKDTSWFCIVIAFKKISLVILLWLWFRLKLRITENFYRTFHVNMVFLSLTQFPVIVGKWISFNCFLTADGSSNVDSETQNWNSQIWCLCSTSKSC